MGTPPKTHPAPPATDTAKPVPAKPVEVKKAPPKKINCFVMDKPDRPGLLMVSTDKVQDGCYVIGFQPQSTTWLVSDEGHWAIYAGKMLKANMAFCAVWAFVLTIALIALVMNRVR